jgi:hypothetical protein
LTFSDNRFEDVFKVVPVRLKSLPGKLVHFLDESKVVLDGDDLNDPIHTVPCPDRRGPDDRASRWLPYRFKEFSPSKEKNVWTAGVFQSKGIDGGTDPPDGVGPIPGFA